MTDSTITNTPDVCGADQIDAEKAAARLNFTRADLHAADVVRHSSAAYWARDDYGRQWHLERAVDALRKAAENLGFDLVERAE